MKKLTFILSITLTLSAFGQVPSYVPANGLVGWWPFNGNANDESGNSLNCTIFGSVTPTDDRFGNSNSAYLWPSNGASGNYMFLPNFTSFLTNSYSISFWMLMDGGSSNPRVFSKGEWTIGTNGTNNSNRTMTFGSGFVGGVGLTQLNIGPVNALEWVHVVWSVDGSFTGGESKVYFNGVLHSSSCCHDGSTNPNWTSVNPSDFNIGRKSTSAFDGFGGKLDDIGIWNRALTPQEVAALYNGCQQSILTQPQSQTASFNDNVQFTAASSDQSATYQWQTNMGVGFQNLSDAGQYSGSSTNTLNVSNVTLSNNNQQFRCIIASGSCSDTSDVALLNVLDNVGLAEQNQMQLLVYPNPASSIITIENPQGLISNFVVVDAQGREVHSGTLNTATTLNLHAFPTGMYTILFENKALQDVKISKE